MEQAIKDMLRPPPIYVDKMSMTDYSVDANSRFDKNPKRKTSTAVIMR